MARGDRRASLACPMTARDVSARSRRSRVVNLRVSPRMHALTLGQASAEEVAIDNRLLGKHRPGVDHYLLSVDLENAAVADRYVRLAFPQVGRTTGSTPP